MPQSQQETINATLIEANEKRIPIQPGIFASLGGISSHPPRAKWHFRF